METKQRTNEDSRIPVAVFDELSMPKNSRYINREEKYTFRNSNIECSGEERDNCRNLYMERPIEERKESEAPYMKSYQNVVHAVLYIVSSIVGALLGLLIIWTLYVS